MNQIDTSHTKTRIIGGNDVAEGRYPYMVSLLTSSIVGNSAAGNGRHFCGGTLITSNVVLTAAHCVASEEYTPSLVKVALNCIDISKENTCLILDVSEIIVSPKYPVGFGNGDDIALLILNELVELETIALAGPNISPPLNGHVVQTIGWGETFNPNQPKAKILQEVTLQVVERDQCLARLEDIHDFRNKIGFRDTEFNSFNLETIICAVSDEKDSCYGDSGGPLFYQCETKGIPDLQIGITSFGDGCALDGVPGAYETVYSTAAIDFIKSTFEERIMPFEDITFIDNLESYCPEQPIALVDTPTPFPTFNDSLSSLWKCGSSTFAAGDGCDCECGLPDPDCEVMKLPENTFNCLEDEICSLDNCIKQIEIPISSEKESSNIILAIVISTVVLGVIFSIIAFIMQAKNKTKGPINN